MRLLADLAKSLCKKISGDVSLRGLIVFLVLCAVPYGTLCVQFSSHWVVGGIVLTYAFIDYIIARGFGESLSKHSQPMVRGLIAKVAPTITASPYTPSSARQLVEKLVDNVDAYLTQRNARRAQRPWLVLSLVAFAIGYVSFAFGPAADGWVNWTVACALASLVSMAVAGCFSEENPPREGQGEMLSFLGLYRPIEASGYVKLQRKISAGRWTGEDLVTLAAAELAAVALVERATESTQLLSGVSTRASTPRKASYNPVVLVIMSGLALGFLLYFTSPRLTLFDRFAFRGLPAPPANAIVINFEADLCKKRQDSCGQTGQVAPGQPGLHLSWQRQCNLPDACRVTLRMFNGYKRRVVLHWRLRTESNDPGDSLFTCLEAGVETPITLPAMTLGKSETVTFEFADVHARRIPVDDPEPYFFPEENSQAGACSPNSAVIS